MIAVSAVLSGIGLFALVWFGRLGSAVGFVAAVIVATFFWSPQFALFPSIVSDYYGQTNSSTNYTLVYFGKVGGGVFGGILTGWLITIVGWGDDVRCWWYVGDIRGTWCTRSQTGRY